jgi:hypothetical protein
MHDSAVARRVLRAALATDLVAFLERAFREIDPDKKLLLHPYVEFLCAELMRVAAGDERRLMSGRRPVVKGCFEAVVNVSGAVMSTAC